MSKRVVDLRGKRGGHPMQLFSAAEKRRPLRTRRRRRRMLLVLALLALLLGILYGLSWLSYHPRLVITEIVVTGTDRTTPQAVEQFVREYLAQQPNAAIARSSIFFYPRREIEEEIPKRFLHVKTAIVTRPSIFSQKVSIAVAEREPFARWCGEECYVLDADGYIFALASSTPKYGMTYIFSGDVAGDPLGQTYLAGRLTGVLTVLERLGQRGYAAEKVIAENAQDFSVLVSRGFYIRATYGANVEQLIRNLELALASEALVGKEQTLEYVDLRFGNRVYYKMKGEAAQGVE